MSETEAHVGRIIPVDLAGKTVDEWIMDKLGKTELSEYSENWVDEFFDTDDNYDKFYFNENSETLYEIDAKKFNPDDYAKLTKNSDGSYNFIASFYNGGTCLREVLDDEIDSLQE